MKTNPSSSPDHLGRDGHRNAPGDSESGKDRGGLCIHGAFELRAQIAPDSVALVFEDQSLTYKQLNERANQLAHYLRARGVSVESLVGICLERSIDLIVALLGVLKAGAAYVPLDPVYPQARLASILEDAQVSIVVANEQSLAKCSYPGTKVVCIDSVAIANESRENPIAGATGTNLSYVIYTSGSTGKPKGVQVEHRSVINLVEGGRSLLDLSDKDVWTVFHSYAFDLSVWEIWTCLLTGGRLVVVPRRLIQAPGEFFELLCRERVTVLNLTPSAARQLIYARQRMVSPSVEHTLRLIICGGESLPGDVGLQLLRWGVPVWNFYGPTEATVWSTALLVDAAHCNAASVPIGRPLANIDVHVLDSQMRPVPRGAQGELYIGGKCLARGYLNSGELTATKFVQNPLSQEAGARLYKTGDGCRYDADGNLEFLGRADQQVKINGFRVELGEIDKALADHAAVREAVAELRTNARGEKRLVTYLVATPGFNASTLGLREFLSQKLPDYMLPSRFIWIDHIPLTANGKIDRSSLPIPEEVEFSRDRSIADPTDLLQLELTKVWEKILAIQPIGIHDNFFDLGGDSLLAVRLFVEIGKICRRNLPLATLVRHPTIAQLATVIQQEDWIPSWSSLVPIQESGSRMPFFCVHAVGGNVLNYFELSRRLGREQPFYALQARGLDGRASPCTSIEEMAAHYIREIRTCQRTGPYFLGGESFGGIVAFEMAQQLRGQGEATALLVLLDATPEENPVRPVLRKLTSRLHLMARMGPVESMSYFARELKRVGMKLTAEGRGMQNEDSDLPFSLREIRRINSEAHENYTPRPYPGPALLFRTHESLLFADMGWRNLIAGDLQIKEVPGDHQNFINEPHVRILAQELSASLQKAAPANSQRVDGVGSYSAEPSTLKRFTNSSLGVIAGVSGLSKMVDL
jgi:aspartate racemase